MFFCIVFSVITQKGHPVSTIAEALKDGSMLGSVAEEKRRDAYIDARDKLYKLFPELQKNQTPCSLHYDRVSGMFEPLDSRGKLA